jgi:glycosyltransferase involved in cell wall biosynthesis
MSREMTDPLVSAVIPTRDRCHLVLRAVHSVLSQSLHSIEVIVVVDGPDEATLQVLRKIDDPRLKIRALPSHLGQAHARNTGAAEASASWVAFLDDDDEWLPGKLEMQLETARQSRWRFPIVSCRMIGRTDRADFFWPIRVPREDEDVSEYLFCRNRFVWGEGVIQSSSIFTSKELLDRVRFNENIRKHDDIDWLLRVCGVDGVGIEFVPSTEPLVIWYREESRKRVSTGFDWRYSLSWIRMNRHLVTPRAYASFTLTWISTSAARAKDWRATLELFREALRYGKPAMTDVIIFIANWLIPPGMQTRIARVLTRSRTRPARPAPP